MRVLCHVRGCAPCITCALSLTHRSLGALQRALALSWSSSTPRKTCGPSGIMGEEAECEGGELVGTDVLRWARCAGRGRGLGLYPRVSCVALVWRSVFSPGFI